MLLRRAARNLGCGVMITFVYRLYNDANELLYIGMSGRVLSRIENHKQSKPWRHEIATVRAVRFPNRGAARKAEREAIRLENPKYNVMHKAPEALLLDKLEEFWSQLDENQKREALAASKQTGVKAEGPNAERIVEFHAAAIALVAQEQRVSCDKIDPDKLVSKS
jgi:predicted GIY-YIG superfamily endonuclease